MSRAAARRDLILGALAIGGGLSIAWLAAQIRGMPGQPFSPGFFPGIIGVLGALVGLVLVLRAGAGRAPALAAETPAGPALRLAALWVVGGIAAVAALFEFAGFAPLLIVWLAGFQMLLGVRPPGALALAVLLVLGLEAAFTRLLGVPLPPGEWRIALGWV